MESFYNVDQGRALQVLLVFAVLLSAVAYYDTSNSLLTTLIYNEASGAIPCAFDNVTVSHLQRLQYHWIYKGNQKLTSALQDTKTGQLEISNAQPRDTGRYVCKVKGALPTNKTYEKKLSKKERKKLVVSLQFSHRLLVYELPDILVTYYRYFKVPKCLKTIDKERMDRYLDLLCRDIHENCPYSISYKCVPSSHKQTVSEALDNPKETLKVVIQIESPRFTPPVCDAKCVREAYDIRVKVLQIRIKTKWRFMFRENTDKMEWYQQSAKPERVRVEEGCPPGYMYFRKAICVACEPGFYWNERVLKCRACPLNTYSENGGSTMCNPCPKNGFTNATKTTSHKGCKHPVKPPQGCKHAITVSMWAIISLVLANMFCGLLLRPKPARPPVPPR